MKSNYGFCSVRFMIILVILASSCNKEDEIAIGKYFGGGIIFYIDNSGQHGLVVASENRGPYAWGCTGVIISGADGSAVGTGCQNTIDMVNGCTETDAAANICSSLELNGYTDWFLPSIDELNLIYINLKQRNLGGLTGTIHILWWEIDAVYWSSTEFDSLLAWYQNFNTGGQDYGSSKNNLYLVRAVRAF